jgi:anthranilate phosphoribosyltransferase
MLPSEPIAGRRSQRQQDLGAETLRFRELIAKVGSGERTSTGLSRAEAAEALTRLLQGQASEAQAGAFLIAHRLRRPAACELAGMLDAYRALGPQLPASDRAVISFGVPFDGRSRSAPVLPLTALLLNAAGLAVVLQGGEPMPVKYGVTNAELLAALGLPLAELDWPTMRELFARQGLALLHQPRHFSAAESLIPVREEIGKRPPIATLELLWSCCPGPHLQVSGFVHAPTEVLMHDTWDLVHQANGLTVKGLEGGVDLPTSRVSIAAHHRGGNTAERLILQARDHGLRAEEPALTTLAAWVEAAREALRGSGPLLKPLLWNGGFYLWRSGQQSSLEDGLAEAERLISCKAVEERRLIGEQHSIADLLAMPGTEDLEQPLPRHDESAQAAQFD